MPHAPSENHELGHLFLLGVLMTGNAVSLLTKHSYLALGDSYTIGEGLATQERWPNQLARALRTQGVVIEDPVFIAKTGWRTDDLKAAIDKAHLKRIHHCLPFHWRQQPISRQVLTTICLGV